MLKTRKAKESVAPHTLKLNTVTNAPTLAGMGTNLYVNVSLGIIPDSIQKNEKKTEHKLIYLLNDTII